MIYDPSKYLLLIIGFYQRSIPLFLYRLQWCCYLKDIRIGNMVSCCSCVGGLCSIDYRHYIFKKIFIDHVDKDTEVEFESFCETGDFNDENPLKGMRCVCMGGLE